MTEPATPERRGASASRISTRVVSVFKEYAGRGPTRARTIIRGDIVVCILEDYLTTGERNLAVAGRERVVHDLRREFQSAMETQLKSVIEEEVGRRVVAFMSANHIEPPYMAEIFVLDAVVGDSSDGEQLAAVPDAAG